MTHKVPSSVMLCKNDPTSPGRPVEGPGRLLISFINKMEEDGKRSKQSNSKKKSGQDETATERASDEFKSDENMRTAACIEEANMGEVGTGRLSRRNSISEEETKGRVSRRNSSKETTGRVSRRNSTGSNEGKVSRQSSMNSKDGRVSRQASSNSKEDSIVGKVSRRNSTNNNGKEETLGRIPRRHSITVASVAAALQNFEENGRSMKKKQEKRSYRKVKASKENGKEASPVSRSKSFDLPESQRRSSFATLQIGDDRPPIRRRSSLTGVLKQMEKEGRALEERIKKGKSITTALM